MPAKARLYIGTTISLGLALLAASLVWFRECPDVARYLACASLACIASTLKVRLPGLHGTISVNFVFILIGIARLSLAEIANQISISGQSAGWRLSLLLLPLMYLVYWYYSFYVSSQTARQQAY